MFSVILVDAIRIVPFLFMSASRIQVIMSAIVSLPMVMGHYRSLALRAEVVKKGSRQAIGDRWLAKCHEA
ncbi:hypothetical protein COLO4_00330 [Corchorus olitorius]|uniref:Uncharacterized protein n=1 Tax=Corchorus olitorius TaxID=93759 RepID=A0A1R3L454_9ROSI|nr:hypothetical protein COLO4_00330 [Corchorus olitorius]